MNASLSPSKPVIGRKLGGVNAVAAKCDCSTRTVYRLSDAGRMPPPIKLGSLVRWDLDEIDEWIQAGCPAVRNVKGPADEIRSLVTRPRANGRKARRSRSAGRARETTIRRAQRALLRALLESGGTGPPMTFAPP